MSTVKIAIQAELVRIYVTYCPAHSESLFKRTADLLVSEGYADVGYKYLIVDDCWMESKRHPITGKLQANKERFPRGLNWLSDYVSVLLSPLNKFQYCFVCLDTQKGPQIRPISRYWNTNLYEHGTRCQWSLCP